MKEEKLLLAMDGIGDDLIAQAMEPHRQTIRRGWVRWVAAAACLCLLLASPVGAVMAESIHKLLNSYGRVEHYILDRISVEDLSEEALAAFPDVEGGSCYLEMDSMDAAEEFLGLELPENDILENAMWDDFHIVTENREELISHCIVRLSSGEKLEPLCADAQAAYRVHGIRVEALYRCPTERNPYENGAGVSFDQELYQNEDYTAINGRKWDLYINSVDFSAQAIGNVNGTLTWVQIWFYPKFYSMESIRALLVEIVEGYN